MFFCPQNKTKSPFLFLFFFSASFLLVAFVTTPHVLAATITVNTTADEVNSNGNCSFREAMQSAETNANVDGCAGSGVYGDDTVDLTGVSGSIIVSNNDRTVTQGLTIIGPGEGALTLSGLGGAFETNRLLSFTPTFNTKILSVSNITLTDFGDGAGIGGVNGGILEITNGVANIDHVTFSFNVYGSDAGGFIYVSSPAELHVTNSTFDQGYGSNGGAISGNSALVTVDNSSFTGNVGQNGGAMYISGGNATISASTFNGNWFAFGAAVYVTNSGDVTVTNTTITGTADNTTFGALYIDTGSTFTMTGGSITNYLNLEGGTSGIENHGTANITNVLIDNNTGDYAVFNTGIITLQGVTISNGIGAGLAGIGIFQSAGTLTIRQSRITHNQDSTYNGAAISQYGGTLTIDQSTIDDNIAIHKGGALFISPSSSATTTNIINSTIANNNAVDDGGGIYMEQPGVFLGTLNFYNTTLSGNTTSSAANGGNVKVTAGSVTIVNSLFVKNGTGKNCAGSGTVTDNGNNIQFGDSTCGAGFTTAGSNPLGSNILADNGGSTFTIALPTGSSAIDAGNNSACADAGTVNNVDQRGDVRPADGDGAGGAVCDVGAYELQPPDSTPPTVTNVTSSKTNGTYTTGEVVPIQVVFSEVVNLTGTPQLTLETGSSDAIVNYTSGSGSNTLTFNYTVGAGQNSSDLDYVGTSSLALNGGTIKDAATNDATLTLATPGAAGSLGANKDIVIDAVIPTITNVTSSTANGTYKASDTVSIQVQFSESVNVTGTPQLALETGPSDAVVDYASGSGSNTLTFTYTVASGENSADLDYFGSDGLTLNGGTIKDVATNDATLTLPNPGAAGSLGANKDIVIDAVAPVFSSVTPASDSTINNVTDASAVSYALSENISSGSIAVTQTGGTADPDSPHNCVLVGTALTSGSHIIDFSNTSNDCGTSVTLVSGGIYTFDFNATDTIGNVATTVTRTNVTFDTSVPDTTAPTVSNVTSSTPNDSYKAGESISIQVQFSENVNVTGTPQLTLETGSSDAVVNYASGSGSDTLTFTYTIASGENSSDLDYVGTSSLALNGGTIKDAATNDADLTLANPGAATSLGANKNIIIDTVAPVFSAVTPVNDSIIDNVTDASDVSFSLSENIASGNITITQTGGTADPSSPHTCTLVGTGLTSGSHVIDFSNAINGCGTSVTLVDGSIYTFAFNGSDAAGNSATAVTNTNIMYSTSAPDVIPPTVTNVTSSKANGTYTSGEVIPIQITFDEAVDVTGTPRLTLETGSTDEVINYVSGSGTVTLTFSYTVISGDTSTDLDYKGTDSLVLNGGTIKDAALNDTTLTLPAPGAAGSLGANKNIIIDARIPSLAVISQVTNPTTDTTPTFVFSSDEDGIISYSPDCPDTVSPAEGATVLTGSIPVTFGPLDVGTYSGCEITVTDAASNISDPLAVDSFTVEASANPLPTPPAPPRRTVGGSGGGTFIIPRTSTPHSAAPEVTPSLPTKPKPPISFNDIKYSPYQKDIVNLAVECNVNGYADQLGQLLHQFHPENKITRSEFVTMLMKCKYGKLPSSVISSFPDVPVSHPASPYVEKGVLTGVVKGYPDGTFKPNRNTNLAEALKMVLLSDIGHIPPVKIKAAKKNLSCGNSDQTQWFSGFYNFALNEHIIFETPDMDRKIQTCFPGDEITRGQAAQIIMAFKK